MSAAQLTALDTLAALDLLVSEDLAQQVATIPGDAIWRHAGRLITAPMARALWLQWNPDQAARADDEDFLRCFRNLLAEAAELGYRLERLRGISARLPDPDDEARRWIPLFEEAIASDDCSVLRLRLSREQLQAFQAPPPSGATGESWDSLLATMADGIFNELGLIVRPVSVQADDELTAPWFRCEWNDLRLPPQRGLDDGRILVNDTAERLSYLNIKADEAVSPATGAPCAIADASDRALVEQAGLTVWDPRGYVVLALSGAIRHAAAALVNRSLAELYLYLLRSFSPDVVSLVEETIHADRLTQILRGLLAEQISVRDLSLVLEAALEVRPEVAPAQTVEAIRQHLRRYIGHKYARGQATISVYLMHPETEDLLEDPTELLPGIERAILDAVRREMQMTPPRTQDPVILTRASVRRRLRWLLTPELPHIVVISYHELPPEMNVLPLARISPELG